MRRAEAESLEEDSAAKCAESLVGDSAPAIVRRTEAESLEEDSAAKPLQNVQSPL